MITYFYVDAFNLYFGSCRGTPYKWLDLARLFAIIFPANQIGKIKYFTARVRPRPGDPGQPTRQKTYLRALETIPNLEIHFGHFLAHTVRMPLAHPVIGQDPLIEVIKTEEKGSDVNLATHLIHDAHLDRFECAIVVSGDSDLLAPVRIVINELKKPVGVLNPQQKPCRVLQSHCTFYRHIRQSALAKSQFSITLQDAFGTFSKPASW
jgi:hypothetical protein